MSMIPKPLETNSSNDLRSLFQLVSDFVLWKSLPKLFDSYSGMRRMANHGKSVTNVIARHDPSIGDYHSIHFYSANLLFFAPGASSSIK